MKKVAYTKPAINFHQQLQQLQDRGLVIEDSEKALHLLSTIGYYRLSGYWYPLLIDKTNHTFKPESTFEKAFGMYKFDRELKLLIAGELEKIEIAFRTVLTYELSHATDPFWYAKSENFISRIKHAKTISKIEGEIRRSKEDYLQNFRKKYIDELPPSWMTLETVSFGSLSFLYENLMLFKEKRRIAEYFGVSDTILESWLHTFQYIRNLCAHHARLWNKQLSIKPKKLNTPKKQWLNNQDVANQKCYYILCMIRYFLQTINPKNTFAEKVFDLINKYPNIDIAAMGFPAEYLDEPLWNF